MIDLIRINLLGTLTLGHNIALDLYLAYYVMLFEPVPK